MQSFDDIHFGAKLSFLFVVFLFFNLFLAPLPHPPAPPHLPHLPQIPSPHPPGYLLVNGAHYRRLRNLNYLYFTVTVEHVSQIFLDYRYRWAPDFELKR